MCMFCFGNQIKMFRIFNVWISNYLGIPAHNQISNSVQSNTTRLLQSRTNKHTHTNTLIQKGLSMDDADAVKLLPWYSQLRSKCGLI